jgi:hypothetical protein
MPGPDTRHTRSVNVTDELWTRLHHGFLDAARAVPGTMTKSEYLERVFEVGLRGVAAELGLVPPSAVLAPPAPLRAPQSMPRERPAAVSASPGDAEQAAPAASQPSARSSTRRKSQAELQEERKARLLERAGAPIRPPVIRTASELAPAVVQTDQAS